jgi:hypothetical protein
MAQLLNHAWLQPKALTSSINMAAVFQGRISHCGRPSSTPRHAPAARHCNQTSSTWHGFQRAGLSEGLPFRRHNLSAVAPIHISGRGGPSGVAPGPSPAAPAPAPTQQQAPVRSIWLPGAQVVGCTQQLCSSCAHLLPPAALSLYPLYNTLYPLYNTADLGEIRQSAALAADAPGAPAHPSWPHVPAAGVPTRH